MISYRDRARANGWPTKASDWIGRSVRLKGDMITAGGTQFVEGERLKVVQVHRGKCVLEERPHRGQKTRTISQVMMLDLELLPDA